MEDYNKAINLNPNDAGFYYNRGILYHDMEKYENAMEDYNKAINLNPNFANSYYM